MKILAINGSISDPSLNGQLLEAIQKQFEGQLDIELADLKSLPIFKEHNNESDPEAVLDLAERIDAADGVIIATPEYNHSIPSSLKSALEWMSYNVNPLENKPVLIVGASTSEQGSARAQTNLRKVLEAPGVNAIAMPGNEFLFGNAEGRFDENGMISDEGTRNFVESVLKKFIRFIDAVSVLQVPEDVEFEPGTYVSEAEGHNGPIPIKVTFSKTRIENIEIDSSNETKGIADVVFERVPEAIIANQTLNVDTVSGASVTQEAVINGIADAVDQAGGNVDVLRKRPKIAKESPQEIKEVQTDVVVVGGGGAGLAAAASAIQNGAEVIVLDKFPAIGGNTNRTGGPMNAADPEWQKSISALPGEDHTLEQIIDTPLEEIHEEYQEDFLALKEEVKEYLAGDRDYLFDSWRLHLIQTYLGGKRVDLEGNEVYGDYDLVYTLAANALDSVHWLEDIGVSFDYSEPQMPVGALWRRGHKPLANEGYAYIEALSNYITENGGQIITDTQVTELTKKAGKIVGLEAVNANEDRLIVKAEAVVMASGGFGSNTPMLQEYNTYWKEIADDIATSNSPAITGDGIKLGEAVGADLVDMGLIQMLPTCDPKTGALFVGLQVPPANFIMVNQEGRRFVNEFGGRDEISKAAIENGGLFWLIADENIKSTAMNTNEDKIRKEIENGDLFKADTLEELAEKINVDPQVLVETVETYNSYVDAGYDPDFGKDAFDLKCEVGPFYATPRRPAIHHTMGGLRIDPDTHVLDQEGEVIEGLYAAGEVAGGIHAGNRLGGNALADIFTFGRIAGENAAKGQ